MGPVLTVDSLLSLLGHRVAFSEVLLVKYGFQSQLKITLTALIVSQSFFLEVIEHLCAISFFQTVAEVAEEALKSISATPKTHHGHNR